MSRLWMAEAIARFSENFEIIVARHLLGSIGCAIGAKGRCRRFRGQTDSTLIGAV
jgi:hypothetical protein